MDLPRLDMYLAYAGTYGLGDSICSNFHDGLPEPV